MTPYMVQTTLRAILAFTCIFTCVHIAGGVEYQSFNADGIILTGVRSNSSTTDDVVLTAGFNSVGQTFAALYQGSLAGAPAATIGNWNILTPDFAGPTVTSSTFYGPNTQRLNPNIPAGQVRAVGSYKYDEAPSGPNADNAMMYLGPVNGVGGTWTQLDASVLVGGGASLLNSIAHSTMGDLVVGNYDTNLATGKAFIYNFDSNIWTDLNPEGTASVTAYGIWQNTATTYTIAGGASDVNEDGLVYGYVLNYDAASEQISNFTKLYYDDQPLNALITHVDGITRSENGFQLTGDYDTLDGGLGAFFADISYDPDTGSFGTPVWTNIDFPGADNTSGNTVMDGNVFGVYTIEDDVFSYVATIPEPSTSALFALAGILAAFRLYNRAKR